jgi:hypothetical protein
MLRRKVGRLWEIMLRKKVEDGDVVNLTREMERALYDKCTKYKGL